MRFLALRLTAFGPFTDLTLDLSGGRFGLHLIHGPNEAGKSASLRALAGLLFGIPSSTTDHFIHDYRSLRVGASLLHSDGSILHVVRRKGTRDTLLDPSGRPLPADALSRYLGGIDETLFSMMFGLTHSGLLRGGIEILRGGGGLGESIFTAGLGATHLREVLQSLAEDAERLFKPKGSLQSIPQALNAYREARGRIQAKALPAADWTAQEQAFQEATAKRRRLEEELHRLSGEKARIERLQRAIPLLAQRRELTGRLASLGTVRLLAPDFAKVRQELTLQRAKLAEQERAAGRLVAEITAKLEDLHVPQAVLDRESQVLELHERLGAYRKGARDLARLQADRRHLVQEAENILRDVRPDLTLDQLETLRLTTAKRSRIRRLATQGEAVSERRNRSRDEAHRLEERLSDTEARFLGMDAPRDPGALRAALGEVRKQGNLEEELTRALAKVQAGRDQGSIDLAGLGLWTGELFELERLPVPPPETVDRFERVIEEGLRAFETSRERAAETERALSEAEEKIQSLELGGPVPMESDLEAARAHRELGWSLVRRAWLEGGADTDGPRAYDPERPLPEAFEASVRQADTVADRLRREASRVAELASLLARRAQLFELDRRTRAEIESAQKRLAELEGDWRAAWQACGIVPLTPKEMRAWIARRDKLATAVQNLRVQQDLVSDLTQRIAAARGKLLDRMREFPGEAPPNEAGLDALTDRCAELVDRIEATVRTHNDLTQAVETLRRDVDSAKRAAEIAEREHSQWQEAWAESMTGLGLDPATSPIEATTLIERIEELFKQVDKAEGIEGRIQLIIQDRGQFELDARALAAELCPEIAGLPPEQIASDLHARCQSVSRVAAARVELESQRVTQQDLQAAAQDHLREIAGQLEVLCAQAGCSTPEELEAAEEKSTQALLIRKELDSLEKQLLEISAGATLDGLAQEAASVDPDLLPRQLREIGERLEALEQERADALSAAVRAQQNLERMDGRADAADAADQAQAALARIREDANTYIRLRLAHTILMREIERYRSENQDPLVRRAGELFERLTLGSFAALQVDYNEQDEPILVGVRPNGKHVMVSGMSEGTRDQLYLCLRLASLERHAARNEPIPFIVDDILVNFDDRRASAGLRVLEELSRCTQVILYTHHDHVVALARKTVSAGALFIHELPGT